MYVCMDGWMDGWVDGWMYVWMDGWMDGWMDVRLYLIQRDRASEQPLFVVLNSPAGTTFDQAILKGD